jgi:pimeloyl-ACP methyl ester carboxylesterase
MSAIVVGQGLVHYEAFGRGRPVVFIHGWIGSWRYWVPTMEDLSVRHKAYAVDLWGFGDSDKPGSHYEIDAYVGLVRGFIDKLGVVHPTLVGHALGGVIALKFAAENPDWVDQVMAVSVPLLGETINRPLAGLSDNGDALAKLVARRAKFSEVEMEVRKTDVFAVSSTLGSALESDLRPILTQLRVPALLVYGSNDPFISSPESDWLEDCDDNVRVISLDGVQHFPMLEQQNQFNRLLKEFLDAGDDLSSLELKQEWHRRLR